MSDLFDNLIEEANLKFSPLADLARPKQLSDVVGQKHLLGEGKPLYEAFKGGVPHSMIFWGPPGVGKTTIANLVAQAFDAEFISLSAVFSGVKEIREAIKEAESYRLQDKRTILFIDEIHRFNKGQQDALLPFVESGLVTFIGATTENPSFEINQALLSRAFVYVLEPLDDAAISELIDRALERYYPEFSIEETGRELLIQYAGGDGRRSLNLLQQLLTFAKSHDEVMVSRALVEKTLTSQPKKFDKGGDYFYDQISALHKSIRGSDPDAALYWFSLMMESGVDPRYLGRRILMIAWEDVGLADPRGTQIATDALTTYERLGSPEGDLALAQAVIYLSCAAKSNAGYLAAKAARHFVAGDQTRPVPFHLRNAPTKLMAELGHGKHYRYAHDEPGAYAAGEYYFPEGMQEMKWYEPTNRGLEKQIGEKLKYLESLDEEARKGQR
ncbi:replication-associated recombination protein A [Ignatzschineria rhizosphaerae]|uniref:Replication-associated recombination protein A n=1 Tax=Ignatzschineria rhizosphaerae TaxID=2923279 RepID=A0ABY3X6K3_9GAMM|nr:replication-associated recombination protein A [Ignatzschineria rhizosphaerae]UNM95628.1 replication-associated recombination protein A [Ignatzschineria rhizosphaerae]